MNRVDASAPASALSATFPPAPKSVRPLRTSSTENNTFTKTAGPVALCAPDTTQQVITPVLSIGSGITWTGSIYTDTLGQDAFVMPFTVVPNTVRVEVDGINRTGDVTITLGPPLVIDLAGIGVYSDTANITITYQISAASASIAGDAPSQTELLFSEFQLNGQCEGL